MPVSPPAVAPRHQPWIRSAAFDGLWILGPPFLALAAVAALPATAHTTQMPVWAWLALVVLIDVAHVYSTLFRTYFDKARRQRFRTLLWAVPLGCYAAGVALYGLGGGLWFWRVLAYAAVLHFVRQQYGFLRLYARQEAAPPAARHLDAVLIYAATLYPLLWWHLAPERNFNWFVPGDFLQTDWPAGRQLLTGLYLVLLTAYVAKELWLWRRTNHVSWPRNLLLLGTAASWYVGIVLFNGDLTFTLLNVVAHGIPYLALVWAASQPNPASAHAARPWWHARYGVGLFLGLLFGLALLEEGLWDGLVWREHAGVFGWFQLLPAVSEAETLAFLVPLLALPQATHYVLDGFIWKRGA